MLNFHQDMKTMLVMLIILQKIYQFNWSGSPYTKGFDQFRHEVKEVTFIYTLCSNLNI